MWVARPVSALAVADLLTGIDALDHRAQAIRWRRIFRLAFPWRLAYWWKGDPVRRILALEPGAYQAVIADFLRSLGRSTALPLATSGTSSPT